MTITVGELINKLQELPKNMKCGVDMVTEQDIMLIVSELDYCTPTEEQMENILSTFHADGPLESDSVQRLLEDAEVLHVDDIDDENEDEDEPSDDDDFYDDDDDYEPEVDEDWADEDEEADEGVDVD